MPDELDLFLEKHGQEIARKLGPRYGRQGVMDDYGVGERRARTVIRRVKELYLSEATPSSRQDRAKIGDGQATERRPNTATVSSREPIDLTTIYTREQLYDVAELDPSEWIEDKLVVNRWAHHFQIKMWLRRKELVESVFPHILPVTLANPLPVARTRVGARVKTALVLGDLQIGYRADLRTGKLDPFHDRRAIDLAVQVARFLQPDVLLVLGDVIDYSEWTDKFVVSPEFYRTTQPAIEEAHYTLARLRQAAPDAELVIIEGNHEQRVERQLLKHVTAAYGLHSADQVEAPAALSQERLLGLDSLGATYIGDYPGGEYWLNAGTMAMHGATTQDERKLLQEANVNLVRGHTHRIAVTGMTHKYGAKGRTLYALNPGCLCRLDGVTPGSQGGTDWQQGLGVIQYEPEGTRASMEAMPIHDGVLFWRGVELHGEERIEELKGAVRDWNF